MNVNFEAVAQQVGLPELARLPQQEIMTDVMNASTIGFADGDIVALHQEYSGRKAELYGELSYSDGLVAQNMGRAAIENAMQPGDIYAYQSFAADYFSAPGSPFAASEASAVVTIQPEFVSVDSHILPVPRVPEIVIDYAACLTGRSFIRDQLNFDLEGRFPFIYIPLTRTHFTNRALMLSYDRIGRPGKTQEYLQHGLYIGREDGVADATEEMIVSQQRHGASTEVADVIISSNAQHATKELLRPGLERAHQLLKEDGMLVIRGLVRPDGDEVSVGDMAGWALESGFEERQMTRLPSMLSKTVSMYSRGHDQNREMETLVLKK